MPDILQKKGKAKNTKTYLDMRFNPLSPPTDRSELIPNVNPIHHHHQLTKLTNLPHLSYFLTLDLTTAMQKTTHAHWLMQTKANRKKGKKISDANQRGGKDPKEKKYQTACFQLNPIQSNHTPTSLMA